MVQEKVSTSPLSTPALDGWAVVESFIRQQGLVRHQIESYDDFILNVIPTLLSECEPLTVAVPALADLKRIPPHPFSNPVTIQVPIGPSVHEEREHVFTFSNPLVTPPSLTEYDGTIVPMTPQIARIRKLTYQIPVFVQVQHDVYRKADKTLLSTQCERVVLCQLPLMLKSSLCVLRNKSEQELYALGECTNDEGGYFIIKGLERALVAQEKMVNNFIYVFEGDGKRIHSQARITSAADGIHKSTSLILIKWINISKKSNIPTYVAHVQISGVCTKKDIPIAILFKALGIVEDDDILRHCGVSLDLLRSSLEEGCMTSTREEALDWIARKNSHNAPTPELRHTMIMDMILKQLFPHVGGNQLEFIPKKAIFLGLVVNRLLNTVNKDREYDDRDHFGNKRVDATGSLLTTLFRHNLKKLFNDFLTQKAFKKLSQNKLINLNSDFDHCTHITNPMLYAFSTGNWGVDKNQKNAKTGVSQILQRLTYIAMISQLRRTITPMNKDGKLVRPRQLHTSGWMRVDPNETPEGEGCGLHKHLTLLAYVSLHTRINVSKLILDTITIDHQIPLLPHNFQTSKLLINGAWIGNFPDGKKIASIIRQLRNKNVIPFDTGIVYKGIDNEVCVFTDAGRLCRPVFVVKNRQLLITPEIIQSLHKHTYPINWLIQNGFVEYIDASEEEELMIAGSPDDLVKYKDDYTHCEIHPALINGITSNMIPFSDHNPSVRVTYSGGFFKQAMGMYTHNYQHRMDNSAHVLFYPQKPLITTKTGKLIHFDEMPSGHNAIVALTCYGGWNCEDSIIVNQSSIDRGMFRSACFKTYEAEEKKMTGNITEDFSMPTDRNETIGYNEQHGYHAIDCHDGLPIPGSKVNGGDVIVAKTHSMPTVYDPQGMSASMLTGLPVSSTGKMTKKDVSLTIKRTDKGIVDKVVVTNNDEVKHSVQDQCNPTRSFIRQRMAKVRIRSVRIPELGDKLAIPAPQKGTIGLLVRQEDMPYTREGITPDVILNPSCFVGETLVSSTNGLSKRIESFSEEGGESVWTFNDDNGFVQESSLGMEYKGEKETVQLTLTDGRTIVCTPDHPFNIQTESGFCYKQAKDIVIGSDQLVMGVEFTEDKHFEDEQNWSLDTSIHKFSLINEVERNKTLAFMRILGYVNTDGCIGHEGKGSTFHGAVNMGCLLDAQSMSTDISLLIDKVPLIKTTSGTFDINITNKLATAIGRLDGMMVGRKTSQEATLPTFLLEESCPKAVIREFLGGFFGGDGHAPYLRDNLFSHIHLSKSISERYKQTMIDQMNRIIFLLNRLQIDACITRTRPCPIAQTEAYRQDPRISVEIRINSKNKDFLTHIGFRHCIQKSTRLTIAASYDRYHDNVLRQTKQVLKKVEELHLQYPKKIVNSLLEEARKELYRTEPPLHYFYSNLDRKFINCKRRPGRQNTPMVLKHKHFPTASQYTELLNCSSWFLRDENHKMNYITKQDEIFVPYYSMKLVHRRADTVREVFDIGVKRYHNFIANGACAHNCVPTRMACAQIFETLFGKVASVRGVSEIDGSIFSTDTDRALNMEQQLKELGFEPHGNEVMYHGATGERIQAKIFIGVNFYMRLKHLVNDKMHCLTADHEVLTSDGWKGIADVTKNDKVAILRDGNELVYENPINTLTFDYNGKMYHISNQAIDLDVTTNHRMYVSLAEKNRKWSEYQLIEAEKLIGKHLRYKKDCKWNVPDYISKEDESVSSTISKLSRNQSRKLLSSFVDDNESVQSVYITEYKEKADDVMRLCIQSGYSAVVSFKNGIYTIDISKDPKPIDVNSSSEEVQEEYTYDYTGKVYCLQVSSEVFMVRKNGKCVWTGNSRSRGKVVPLFRQPSEGRSRDGGFRVGEMEVSALTAHGVSCFIKERLFTLSDEYATYFCDRCGFFAVANFEKHMFKCGNCGHDKLNKINLPYACKLLFQELMAMGIVPRVRKNPIELSL